MKPIINSARIFAILGNKESLVPLGIKDVCNTAGITAGAYITGNAVEGKDRLIDEVGTQAIWLLGIPFFKKIINKTVYKMADFNPNIDSRFLDKKNKDVFEVARAKAKEIAKPDSKLKIPIEYKQISAQFEKIAKKQNLFKGLAIGKFVGATVLTMISYSTLTKFRHKHTEKVVMKELQKEEALKKANEEFAKNKNVIPFDSFKNKQQKNPSFGMKFGFNAETLKQFMFDPVKNTMIVDGAITSERLIDSRNPQDFMGYVIKEGGFWAFMYWAGPAIQSYFEKAAAKKGNPIDLDIRVLDHPEFQKALADKSSIEKHLKNFSTAGTDAEIYERLFSVKEDNLVLQMAKLSEIIKTIPEEGINVEKQKVDPQAFVEIEQVKAIKERIAKIAKELSEKVSEQNGASKEEKVAKFFEKIKSLKRASILKNIVVSATLLGVFVPGVMVALRFADKNNKDFMVKKQMKEKMKKEKANSVSV